MTEWGGAGEIGDAAHSSHGDGDSDAATLRRCDAATLYQHILVVSV